MYTAGECGLKGEIDEGISSMAVMDVHQLLYSYALQYPKYLPVASPRSLGAPPSDPVLEHSPFFN